MKNSAKANHWAGPIPVLAVLMILPLGCATKKEKPVFQRGWIGGEYKLAQARGFSGECGALHAFPASLGHTQKAGILVTALSSNTPARLAGLREGDLILRVGQGPVSGLKDFRRRIDLSEPGSLLPVSAYRDGKILDYKV